MKQPPFMQVLAAALALFVNDLSIAFNLPYPFTATDLRDAVASWRGIRIDLVPQRMGTAKVYGLCVCKSAHYYVIFYRSDAVTRIQQQRIIFHELCHIILSHVTPLTPMHVLREPLTLTLQEQEAEIFAGITNAHALALGRKMAGAMALADRRDHTARDDGTMARVVSSVAGAGKQPLTAAPVAPVADTEPSDLFDEFLEVMGG